MRRPVVSRPNVVGPAGPPAGSIPGPLFYPHSVEAPCRAQVQVGVRYSVRALPTLRRPHLRVRPRIAVAGGRGVGMLDHSSLRGLPAPRQPIRIVVPLTDPQPVQHDRQLARYGHGRALLRVVASTRGDRLTVAPQVTCGSERTQDVMRGAHQQPASQLIARLGDSQLRPRIAAFVQPRDQSEVCADVPALSEASRVLHQQHEGQRRQRSHAP